MGPGDRVRQVSGMLGTHSREGVIVSPSHIEAGFWRVAFDVDDFLTARSRSPIELELLSPPDDEIESFFV